MALLKRVKKVQKTSLYTKNRFVYGYSMEETRFVCKPLSCVGRKTSFLLVFFRAPDGTPAFLLRFLAK